MDVFDRLRYRLQIGLTTVPQRRDWQYAVILLGLFAVIYLPIGFTAGFLKFDWRLNPGLMLSVAAGALIMPGIIEEFIFRLLLMPHRTESLSVRSRQFWTIVSWLLFLLYHMPPWTPAFFKTPIFLLGAGLLGIACTISYWQSRSIWTAVLIHWVIVAVWLLCLGGLGRFESA
jgi:uncharacterized protein